MKVAVFLLLALATASQALTWEKPEFCGNYECIPFKVEDERDSYVVRSYEGAFYVENNVTDTKFECAYVKANAALLKYFKGENDAELTMNLTTPTFTLFQLKKDSQEPERDYSFYLWLNPDDFEEGEEKPPKPSDKDLNITKSQDCTVFVRSFGGFATENTIMNEVNALKEELIADEEDFEEDFFWVFVYDPVTKLMNRHNEVLINKKSAPSRTAQVSYS